MEKRLLVLGVACVVLLSGCDFIKQFIPSGDGGQKTVTTEKEKLRSEMSPEEKQLVDTYGRKGGEYTEFSADVIGNGKTSILFFHAPWCPDCKKHDELLQDWYSVNYMPLSVYTIDYDSETEQKSRFGVATQDTFIRIDGEGNAVQQVSFPSEIDLLNLLRP